MRLPLAGIEVGSPVTLEGFLDRQQTPRTQPRADLNLENFLADQERTPKPSATLPAPETADQITTQNAQIFAQMILAPPQVNRTQMEATAPGIPAAPLPAALQTDAQSVAGAPVYTNPRTGQRSPMVPPGQERGPFSLLDAPITGGQQMVAGVEHAAQPGLRAKVGGASQVFRGGLEAASPLMVPELATPLRTLATVGAGMIAQSAVQRSLKKLDMPEEYASAAGDLAGVIAGVGSLKLTPRAAKALRTKYEPVLRARFERAQESQPTASITGREPYRPTSELNLETFLNGQATKEKSNGKAETSSETQPSGSSSESSGQSEAEPTLSYTSKETAPVKSAVPESEHPIEKAIEPPEVHAAASQPAPRTEVPGLTPTARNTEGGPVYGKETSIAVPGEETSYPARYSIREAADMQPSHNPHSFEPNPRYEYQNDRDYRNNAQLSSLVIEHAGPKFNPEFVASESPTAEHGAPVVDARGNVLGGNSRSMTLSRVYQSNPAGAEAYRAALRERAPSYGLEPSHIDRYTNPVLVREVAGGHDAQKAITDFNKSGPAALSPAERAVADGRRLSTSTVNELAGMLADVGEDSTLAQALRGDNGAHIVNLLADDGVITPQEKNGLLDERGVLTGDAKDRIARMLVGRLFDSPAAFNNTPPELRNKLERVAPHVLRVEDRPDWNITPYVREAVNALADARAHGIKHLDDLARQQLIGGGTPDYARPSLAIAQTLRQSPLAAAQAFRRYANDEALSRDGGQASFFNPPTQDEAFTDAFHPTSPVGNRSERGAVSPELLTLGIDKFWKDDVAPRLAAAARGITETAEDIRNVVAPQVGSSSAKQAALILRGRLGEFARQSDQAVFALRKAKRAFDWMSPAENYQFIARIENGEAQPAPELEAIAQVMRAMLDGRRDQVQALGTGKLQQFFTHYFPHAWADPKRAAQVFASFFKRGPLEGGKSFLKKRSYLTFEDGLAAGLKPVSDNPVDLVLLKVREMDKYITAHRVLDDWRGNGLAKYVDAREGEAPAGWQKIVDPIGTVYGPSVQSIPEYPNRGTYEALAKVADNLGLTHGRGFHPGGPALGYASATGLRGADITTRHGTAEDVLAHEIGHHLDWKYGLGDRFENYPGGDVAKRIKDAYAAQRNKNASPAMRREAREMLASVKSEISRRGVIKKELRALADLRNGRKEYVRNRAEKMAAMAQAWVGAREKFQQVAPTVYREFSQFLDAHPELAPLRNIEGDMNHATLQQPYDVGGLVIRGNWYSPPGAARILNNHLMPGLSRFAIFRAAMGLNNELNLFNLGLSGFHVTKTAFEASISKGALGIESLLRGHPIDATKHLLAVPTAPFTAFMRGEKLLREWYTPGESGGPIGKIMDDLTGGGARGRMDQMYRTQVGENMLRALRSGNLPGAVIRLPFAAMEVPTRLIMDEIVPRMKMGTMADMAAADLKRLGPDASAEDVRRVMAETVNSVDNRMGEVARDNLFWNRYARDLGMFLMRADQYFLGTVREIGGAAVDLVHQPVNALRGEPVNLKRISYVASMLMVHMATSAIYQKLHTGKWPEESEDYFYPKNGTTDENGHPQRVSLWSYIKDVDSFRRNPVRTLQNKEAPAISMFSSLLRNKDFRDTEIRHADDPLVDQAKDVAKFIGKQFEPRSIENLQREKELGASPAALGEQFGGISPAPADLDLSPAERMARELSAAHGSVGGRTQEQAERSKLRHELTRSLRSGKGASLAIIEARKAGTLSREDLAESLRAARRTPLQNSFNGLGIDDAYRVYVAASADERKEIRPMLAKKARAAIKSAPPAQRTAIAKKLSVALAGTK